MAGNISGMLGRQLKNKRFLDYRTPNVYPRMNSSLKRGVTRKVNPRMRALRRL
jgi:hypothetical protein